MIFIILGLTYGDEGKGSVVDFLCRKFPIDTVIRFNGGAQAAHHVVSPPGVIHCFSQLGSGSFVEGVKTHLSRFMLVEPLNLIKEEEVLESKGVNNIRDRLTIDPRCPVITPLHKMIGQMKETARGNNRLGSVGMGIGELVKDIIGEEEEEGKGNSRNSPDYHRKDCFADAGNDRISSSIPFNDGLSSSIPFNDGLSSSIVGNDKEWGVDKTPVIHIWDFSDEDKLYNKIKIIFDKKLILGRKIYKNNPSPPLENLFLHFINNITPASLLRDYRHFMGLHRHCIARDEEILTDIIRESKNIILEGAQGTLLDPLHGFYPYITKTPVTFSWAREWLQKNLKEDGQEKKIYKYKTVNIGVCRAYGHRHGAGPFVTEDEELTRLLPELHNKNNPWQGDFRVGWMDLMALRYSLQVNKIPITGLCLTASDRLTGMDKIRICTSYQYKGKRDQESLNLLDRFFVWEKGMKGEGQEREEERKREEGREEEQKKLESEEEDIIRITGIKVLDSPSLSQARSDILFNCVPLDFKEFPGWREDLSLIKEANRLPMGVKQFLEFLESEKGLGVPVIILSMGERADEKLLRSETLI